MSSNSCESEPIYLDLASESDDPSVTVMETLCMQCYEKGTTRLLLTMIEHFREVMVSSFSCPHCNYSNNSLMSTATVQDKGRKYTLKVCLPEDLSRMVVRSDKAIIKIPEVDLEVPSRADSGEITSVEGLVRRVIEGLQQDQDSRRAETPELADQIQAFVQRLTDLLQLSQPFTIELDDPTGNSYIDRRGINGLVDPQLTHKDYTRTLEVDEMLGLLALKEEDNEGKKTRLDEVKEEDEDEDSTTIPQQDDSDRLPVPNDSSSSKDTTSSLLTRSTANKEDDKRKMRPTNDTNRFASEEADALDVRTEVMQFFGTLCDSCHRPAQTNMKVTRIPHFKEVIIMATVCDHCGGRSTEIKSGSGIEPKGSRFSLRLINFPQDLGRDVVKSDTCSINIPELNLQVGGGILGGKYTTVEGLLLDIKDDLSKNPFFFGDSVEQSRKDRIKQLFEDMDKVMQGTLPATLILDDPAGNSFVGSLEDDGPDAALTVTRYERTFEQKEELGLNDMITEGYEKKD